MESSVLSPGTSSTVPPAGNDLSYAMIETLVGSMLAVGTPGALVELRLPASADEHDAFVGRRYPRARHNPARFARLADELDRYYRGESMEFTEALAPIGTAFQQAVWRHLLAIPRGQTSSYARVAVEIGRPGAARAVGQAVGANPIAVVIPCHRVLASNGRLGGYGGGLPMKNALLRIEGITIGG